MDRGSWQATVYGVAIIRHDLATKERERVCVCVEKRECSCTVGVNVNCYSHYGRQYRDFCKKLGIKPPYDSAVPLLGTYP